MEKDKTYWQIISMCKDGVMYKRIASMLTGVDYDEICRDCKGKFYSPYLKLEDYPYGKST